LPPGRRRRWRRRHVGRVHAQHRAGARQPGGGGIRVSPGRAGRQRQRLSHRLDHQGPQGPKSWPRSAASSKAAPSRSRTTARPCRSARDHAAGARVLPDVRQGSPEPLRGPRPDPRRRHARGLREHAARPARHAVGRGEVMVHRDIALAEMTGGPAAHPARLHGRQRRPNSPGAPTRGPRHPAKPARTISRSPTMPAGL